MRVISVNISEQKGTVKKPVGSIELNAEGVRGDAHAGLWHRQVSLLARESFEKFEKVAGRSVAWGEFAENITTEGLILYECKPFDRIVIGETILEVTQIGKSCHGDSCAIFREVGSCVMPKEGIFCRVIRGGVVHAGDEMHYQPKTIRNLVITLSDRAYRGEYTDRSGPRIVERLASLFDAEGWPVETESHCIPDDAPMLESLLASARNKFDFIFTTGGTGLGARDITVDTVARVIDREIPGVMDLIRITYGAKNPNALLSRSIAGMIGETALFALPGSVKAVDEYLDEIQKVLVHLLYMVHGIDKH